MGDRAKTVLLETDYGDLTKLRFTGSGLRQ